MSNENPYGTNQPESPYEGGGSQANNPSGPNPPEYGQQQYGQPQYGQPQYGQPQYGQQAQGDYQAAPSYESAAYSQLQPVDPPQPLLTAVKLMLAGAVLSLISILLSFTMKDEIRNAVIEANNKQTGTKKLDASGIDAAVTFAMVAGVVIGLIGVGLWLWMARANKNGKKWARIVATVLCVLSVLSFVSSVSQGTAPGLSLVISALITLVGIAAAVLLWNKANRAYYDYKSAPRA